MRLSFSRVLSAAMCGMEVIPVQVEADVSNGLPLFHMVGYLGAEVREAEERVRTAIQNACAALPPKRMVINLSPGNVRKRGTSYDLPIALAVLAAAGLLQQECLEQVMAVSGCETDIFVVMMMWKYNKSKHHYAGHRKKRYCCKFPDHPNLIFCTNIIDENGLCKGFHRFL